MSRNFIDLLDHTRVQLGCVYLNQVINYISEKKLDINLVYLFKSQELVINDDALLGILNLLDIPFKESLPQNTLKFVLK